MNYYMAQEEAAEPLDLNISSEVKVKKWQQKRRSERRKSNPLYWKRSCSGSWKRAWKPQWTRLWTIYSRIGNKARRKPFWKERLPPFFVFCRPTASGSPADHSQQNRLLDWKCHLAGVMPTPKLKRQTILWFSRNMPPVIRPENQMISRTLLEQRKPGRRPPKTGWFRPRNRLAPFLNAVLFHKLNQISGLTFQQRADCVNRLPRH